MSGYWEPWQPQEGQRVRVLARPECAYCAADEDSTREIGAVGTIVSGYKPDPVRDGPDAVGHRYWVRFETGEFRGEDAPFAVIELEPVREQQP